MRIRTRTGTKICKNIDIHRNPEMPGASRIPYDVCDYVIDDFLKNEIISTKLCACPSCDARRHVLRRLQEIVAEWKKYKKDENWRIKQKCQSCCQHK